MNEKVLRNISYLSWYRPLCAFSFHVKLHEHDVHFEKKRRQDFAADEFKNNWQWSLGHCLSVYKNYGIIHGTKNLWKQYMPMSSRILTKAKQPLLTQYELLLRKCSFLKHFEGWRDWIKCVNGTPKSYGHTMVGCTIYSWQFKSFRIDWMKV